jgi:hypothetical protein
MNARRPALRRCRDPDWTSALVCLGPAALSRQLRRPLSFAVCGLRQLKPLLGKSQPRFLIERVDRSFGLLTALNGLYAR